MKPRSTLLRSLMRSFRKASIAEKYPEIDAETLVQLDHADPYTRRKFITETAKALAIIGAGSVLPFTSCRLGTKKDDDKSNGDVPAGGQNKVKIAIIGGGIAGLNCAYQLKKQGITSTIYEGDKRVGGRIYSQYDIFGKGIGTEFGAEFIDTDHDDMKELCTEFNLKLLDTSDDVAANHLIKDAYFLNGRHHTEKQIVSEFKKVAAKIKSDRDKCGPEYDTPHCEKLDQTPLEAYIRSLAVSKWMQDLLIFAYAAEYGLDAGEQSAMNFVGMIGTDMKKDFQMFGDSDELFKIEGGNSKVITALQENLKDQIITGSRLTAIRNSGSEYLLVFDGAKEVKAEIVVLAVPFTKLRNGEVDIQLKEMTDEKRHCIDNIGYGMNNKLILGFDKRVWREGKNKYAGYLFHPDIPNGWDSSQMQGTSGPGSYTIFLGGTNSVKLAAAAKAAGMRDAAPESFVQEYLSKLDQPFKGAKAAFNGISRAALWTNNPFVNGSYACYKVGQWSSISGNEITPIGNVFFAGEHCSENHQGFMNGGATTGKVAAGEIVKKLGVSKVTTMEMRRDLKTSVA